MYLYKVFCNHDAFSILKKENSLNVNFCKEAYFYLKCFPRFPRDTLIENNCIASEFFLKSREKAISTLGTES